MGWSGAAGANDAASATGELAVRRQEASLLSRRLDLGSVRRWDRKQRTWRPLVRGSEQILVLQLWAVECGPCLAEMPLLRRVVQGWRSKPAVRFFFVSETLDQDLLTAYWTKQHVNDVPDEDPYQSTDSRLRDVLEMGTQPVTLILDRDLVVRQAFVGTVTERVSELAAGINRLLALSAKAP